MAVSNFLPNVWSARLQANLAKQLVYGNCVNTDYEGEILDQGASVKINELGDITVSTYDRATGIGTPTELDSTLSTLSIDQAKFFAFNVHDADAVQANVDLMDEAMRRASFNLADAMDQYIASLYTAVDAANTIGSDVEPVVLDSAAKAYDNIVDLGVKLDEANVPAFDRFVVVPSWVHGLILKDSRFVTNDPALRASGAIASVDGMLVYKSNNVPDTAGAKYKVMAGYKGAIAFAHQITKVEAVRSATHFADVVRGLALYGAKVVQPKGIAVLTCSKA